MQINLEVKEFLSGTNAMIDYETIREPTASIEIADDVDVIVVGGGTAGVPAAIAAARQGANVLLLEANSFLGGSATASKVHIYYHGAGGGIQAEIDQRVNELHKVIGEKTRGFHPEAKKYVLQEMALEAGVKIYFRTMTVGVLMDETTVRGVVVENISGRKAIIGKVTIDSTGDADVAAIAGAPFLLGRETDGFTQPYSLCPSVMRDGMLTYWNFDAGWLNPTNLEDISRAQFEGRKHLWREDGFDDKNRLLGISPILGIREGRQIVGEYTLTLEDEAVGRRFSDVMCRCKAHYDNHAVDYENESELAQIWVSVLGFWSKPVECDVPYRCMVPQGIDNVLVACRSLSIDHDAQMAFRMQRSLEVLGEAAGVAAAIAAKENILARDVCVTSIQKILVESGALPAEVLTEDYEKVLKPEPTVEESIKQLGSEKDSDAIWHLTQLGEKAVPALIETLSVPDQNVRLSAVTALGILKRDEAIPELVKALSAETPEKKERRAANRKTAAIILLGQIGNPEVAPELIKVLESPDIDINTAVFTIKALGKLGDATCVEPIKKLVQSDVFDKPSQMQGWVKTDFRWSLDIAAGMVLTKFGDDYGVSLIRKYLSDERVHVREYAQRKLGNQEN